MEENKEILQKQNQIKKGIIAYAVLLCIDSEESYSLNILENLKKSNIIIVEGTLYPLLSRFKKENLLNYEWRESSSGPPRKYYTLTEKGKETLEFLKITWGEVIKSIKLLTKLSGKK